MAANGRRPEPAPEAAGADACHRPVECPPGAGSMTKSNQPCWFARLMAGIAKRWFPNAEAVARVAAITPMSARLRATTT